MGMGVVWLAVLTMFGTPAGLAEAKRMVFEVHTFEGWRMEVNADGSGRIFFGSTMLVDSFAAGTVGDISSIVKMLESTAVKGRFDRANVVGFVVASEGAKPPYSVRLSSEVAAVSRFFLGVLEKSGALGRKNVRDLLREVPLVKEGGSPHSVVLENTYI